MTDSILRTAAVALLAVSSLFSVACSSTVAEPARSAPVAAAVENVDVASACAGDDFASCLHATDVARQQGDAVAAFDALRARCQSTTGDERTASNACFAAIGIAARDLGDEALAASVAKFRCDRFGTKAGGMRVYACPVDMPSRDVDGAAASLGAVRLPRDEPDRVVVRCWLR